MSTTTEQLDSERWAGYFDSLAPRVEGVPVTIEVMSGELGDQVDVEKLTLQSIGYDHKDDMLEVAVGGQGSRYPAMRHFIAAPTEISVEGADDRVPSSILVTDAGGVRTLIRLYVPAALGT